MVRIDGASALTFVIIIKGSFNRCAKYTNDDWYNARVVILVEP